MTTKELIRAEIERRLKRDNEILWNAKLRGTTYPPSVDVNLLTLTSLRDFLDTLPEEPMSEDLEEAAEHYAAPFNDTTYGVEYSFKGFKAGAEYQYQKDRAEFAKLKAKEWSDGYEDGAKRMKEKMVQDAIDIKVIESYNPACDPDERLHGISFIYDCKNGNQYLVAGDRAKIIIIKEDEK